MSEFHALRNALYARFPEEAREYESEFAELQARLAAMERGGVCIWCGEALDLTGKDMGSAVAWARQHDEQCPDNPLRARLAEAEAALRAIVRGADEAKEPCGSDPESAAAIRNGRFATLAQMAAQGLGWVKGPPLGAADSADVALCAICNGTGAVDAPTSEADPVCSACDGEGK